MNIMDDQEDSISFRVVQERWWHKIFDVLFMDIWGERKTKVAVIQIEFPVMVNLKTLNYCVGKNKTEFKK